MGCGCKNKTNEQQAQPVQTQQNGQNIQNAVQKIVEKYYNKK